jgi:ribosomal protein S18 acetylase RimI-like enzyme
MGTIAEWPVGTLHADIELARIDDPEAIASLWDRCGGRSSPGAAAPAREIVARERGTSRVIGVAEFIRTFPPEDALASLCVDPAFRRMGIGGMLLEAIMASAASQGRRNLCGFVSEANLAARKLLESSRAPARVYETDDGCYVELETMRRRSLDLR